MKNLSNSLFQSSALYKVTEFYFQIPAPVRQLIYLFNCLAFITITKNYRINFQ
jgi:hypothetical protein